MAEVTQQPPEAGRDRAAGVVVDDHQALGRDAGQPHLGLEPGRGRERVPAGAGGGGDRLQIDEDGARDVACVVSGPAAAAVEIPAKVDDPQVGIGRVLRQPGGVHQRFHAWLA